MWLNAYPWLWFLNHCPQLYVIIFRHLTALRSKPIWTSQLCSQFHTSSCFWLCLTKCDILSTFSQRESLLILPPLPFLWGVCWFSPASSPELFSISIFQPPYDPSSHYSVSRLKKKSPWWYIYPCLSPNCALEPDCNNLWELFIKFSEFMSVFNKTITDR